MRLSSLAVAAFVAVAVGISTYAIRLAKEETSATKVEFEAYKVTVEGKVADSRKEGIEARGAAGNALVRAAELEKQASELRAANLARLRGLGRNCRSGAC